MKTGLPESVVVGPYRYTVRIEDTPFVDDQGTGVLCGQHNPNEGLIRVLRGSADRMFVTLWHEMLHAIDDVAGTELSEDEINRLAPVLVGALFANGYVTRDTK